jgi:hypothetical protein
MFGMDFMTCGFGCRVRGGRRLLSAAIATSSVVVGLASVASVASAQSDHADRTQSTAMTEPTLSELFGSLPADPGSQPFTDLDPSTTYDPTPNLTVVDNALTAIAPSAYGGSYQTPDGTIHVGLTGAAASVAQQLLDQFPTLPITTFAAQYSWSTLTGIADALTQEFATQPTVPIVSITPDVETNTVQVGFSDITHPAALALQTQYGSAVQIVPQQPYEDLGATAPAPAPAGTPDAASANPCYGRAFIDRAKPHQPGYGGLCMYLPTGTPLTTGGRVPAPGALCTTGFGMELPGSNPNGVYDTEGFFTAGHCVYDNKLEQIWYQGNAGERFGIVANNSIRPVSHSDAGTIVTNNVFPIDYRNSSNLVAFGPGSPPVQITERMKRNAMPPHSDVVISGSITGTVFGAMEDSGRGSTIYINRNGVRYTELYQYKAKTNKVMALGDSGAPVYQGPNPGNQHGVAIGILTAREIGDPTQVVFSQIEWVESDTGWITKTS